MIAIMFFCITYIYKNQSTCVFHTVPPTILNYAPSRRTMNMTQHFELRCAIKTAGWLMVYIYDIKVALGVVSCKTGTVNMVSLRRTYLIWKVVACSKSRLSTSKTISFAQQNIVCCFVIGKIVQMT